MSTDPNGTYPTGATPAEPFAPPAVPEPVPTGTQNVLASDDGTGAGDESFFARHSGLITAAMTAIIVAAVAIAGTWLWHNHVDDKNTANEAAFSKFVQGQGSKVDTVECNGGSCAAIIGGTAYSVLVQEDANGKQHFGVSAYAGN
jgi:hypothetical protein